MITPEQTVEAVADFCQVVIPELQEVYDYMPEMKKAALPDCVVQLTNSYTTLRDPEFPFWQIQEANLMVFKLSCSFMVDNRAPDGASVELRTIQQRLTVEALKSATLQGRVPMRSPYWSFGYTPPLVEYEDGTIGREITWQLSVADLIPAEE